MKLSKSQKGQLMYIFEAALEYLISILVAGSFLATLTSELGFSDSLTGILSSIISLGCLFQMLSLFLRRKKVKRFIIFMSITNQLMFMLLYVVPVFTFSKEIKTVIFVITIVLAYLIYNFAHPKKIGWLMSLVDNEHRGRFTATKEIISLLAGMGFSYVMGALVDYFSAKGDIKTALILSAIVIFCLMLLHTATLLFTPEPEMPQMQEKSIGAAVQELLNNKNVIHVTIIFILYYISTYVATPFYGTYLIHELALSLKVVSLLTIISSMVRISFSRFWGSYADKTSFTNMIQKCLLVLGFGYLCAALAVPKNGLLMFALYYIFHGAALGGINSALINLVFDYVSVDKRSDSLAICQAGSGLMGFIATLLASPLVSSIQKQGNHFLGIHIYAQQVVSIISCFITFVIIIYIRKKILKSEK